ncbi:MFS transporter [Vagococcus elongatus]|uniref:MFS transporter n=1 Tax=Vagococcus elongatus TaxID=180344 RepID=UPI001476AD54|nr:MFS transporter [Vagococcus elongatus]
MTKGYTDRLKQQLNLLQGIYWVAFCSISGFATVFLLTKGLSSSTIGIIIASASLISVFAQFATGFILDRFVNLTVKKVLLGYAGATTVLNALILLVQSYTVIVALLYCVSLVFLFNVQPLITTLVYQYINSGLNTTFSFSRGIGSLTYALTSFFLGKWLDAHSSLSVPVLSTTTMVVLFILLLTLPKVNSLKKNRQEDEGKRAKETSLGEVFRKYPTMLGLLVGLCCIFIFHTVVNVFLPQMIDNVGGKNTQVGYAIALAAFCEIPIMLSFQRIEARFTVQNTLKISGVFFFIRSLIYYFAGTFLMFLPAQLLQSFSFALITPAYAHYVNEIMAEEDQVKGQTFVMAAVTLGNVVGSLVGGQLVQNLGVSAMLLFGVLLSFVGMLVLFYTVKKEPKQNTPSN